jgi:ABC-2 type transport system permease protein
MPWDELAIAAVSSVVVALLALLFVARMLATFRRRGFVTRYS